MTNYERALKGSKESLAWLIASFGIGNNEMCKCCEYCNLILKRDEALKWLNEEIKLSSKERYTLEKLEKTYEWIAREKDGTLWVYEDEPCKDGEIWFTTQERYCLDKYNDLFDFIKWTDYEAYNIKELLK